MRGSTVTVQELDSTLSPTGRSFQVTTNDDEGDFTIPVNVSSQYIEVIASGYYFDELTSALSASPLTLHALADLTGSGTVDVNLLTSMSEPLVRNLVAGGASFSQATAQGESAVLSALGFGAASLGTSFSSVALTGSSSANAEPLAASLIVEQYARSLGSSEVAQLSQLLGEVGAATTDSGGDATLGTLNAALCSTIWAIDPRPSGRTSSRTTRRCKRCRPSSSSSAAAGSSAGACAWISRLTRTTAEGAATPASVPFARRPRALDPASRAPRSAPATPSRPAGPTHSGRAPSGVATRRASRWVRTPELPQRPARALRPRTDAMHGQRGPELRPLCATPGRAFLAIRDRRAAPVAQRGRSARRAVSGGLLPPVRRRAPASTAAAGRRSRPAASQGVMVLTNCGASSESCCTSLEVPGGTFLRQGGPGCANAICSIAGGPPLATVSGFRLDKYMVTVGRYRQFVNAVLPPDGGPGWLPVAGSGKHVHVNAGFGLADEGSTAPDGGAAYEPGWVSSDDANVTPLEYLGACTSATWTSTPGSNETLPINCVNSYEAFAFSIWDGGFLASEAEWQYAAFGGSQQRPYPWGTTDPGSSNLYASGVAPVGTATLGAGLWGQMDLAGELDEWNLDWFANVFVVPCTDCAWTTVRVYRLTAKGGSGSAAGGWYSVPNGHHNFTGFRCARTP